MVGVSDPRVGPVAALLKVILVLLVLDFGATIYLILAPREATPVASVAAQEPLPEGLASVQGRTELYDRLVIALNAHDAEGLWAMIDPSIRPQLEAKWEQALPTIFSLTGQIKDGAYSHYEYGGESMGKQVYLLYYSLLTDRGPAMLCVTVAKAADAPYALWGLNVQMGD